MSYVLSGYKRSLSVSVTKTINGVTQAGYPKTYPTATDIANGYFTYNAVNYSIPPNGITDDEFAQLTDIEYNQLLNAFRLYVMSLEDGLDFNTDATNSPEVYDASTCPPGTVVGTTTVEVTTTGEVTTTEVPATTEEVPTTTVEQTLITNIVGYSALSAEDACSNPPAEICVYGSTDSLATTTYLHTSGGSAAAMGYYLYPGHYRIWDGSSFTGGATYVCGNEVIPCPTTTEEITTTA